MKIVGRVNGGEDVLRDVAILQRTLNRLRGVGLVPRGVHSSEAPHRGGEAVAGARALAGHFLP